MDCGCWGWGWDILYWKQKLSKKAVAVSLEGHVAGFYVIDKSGDCEESFNLGCIFKKAIVRGTYWWTKCGNSEKELKQLRLLGF